MGKKLIIFEVEISLVSKWNTLTPMTSEHYLMNKMRGIITCYFLGGLTCWTGFSRSMKVLFSDLLTNTKKRIHW